MFRHGTYYIIANDSDKTLETIVINYANTIGFSYHYEKHVYYITVNGVILLIYVIMVLQVNLIQMPDL